MKLRAADLRTEELWLELPREEGGANTLLLGPSGGVTGGYEQSAREIVLDHITASELLIRRLVWRVAAAAVESRAPIRLEGVGIDATIALGEPDDTDAPFVGSVELEHASLEALEVNAGVTVLIEGLHLRGVRAVVDRGGAVEASVREANVRRLCLKRGPLEVVVNDVALPTGLTLRGHDLAVPRVSSDSIEVRVGELAPSPPTSAAASAPETTGRGSDALDAVRRVLDALQGQVDVDLRVDATVPVLGRRRATHHFRIPVAEGAIDYHQLEHDLATLEDAFIDFKVKKDRLILERNIPLVPFGSRTLVYWELDTERDRALAAERRVRLAKLTAPEVPTERAQEEVEEGKRGVVLRRLDFDSIDAVLSVGHVTLPLAVGTVEIGGPDRAGVGRMELRGDVRYEPDRPLEHTDLHIAARDLCAVLHGLALGERNLRASQVNVGSVDDVRIGFDGVRPCSLAATIRAFDGEGIELTPAS